MGLKQGMALEEKKIAFGKLIEKRMREDKDMFFLLTSRFGGLMIASSCEQV